MHPRKYALSVPDRVAARIVETGEELTYAQLDERSTRLARAFASEGLREGDVVALLSGNELQAFEVFWAALRSGLYVTAVNHHLAPDEVVHIVHDSEARVLIASADKGELAASIVDRTPGVTRRFAFGGDVGDHESYEAVLAASSSEPLDDEPAGAPMLYSSGTTGKPKGIKPPLPGTQVSEGADFLMKMVKGVFGVGDDTVYLQPAPIYHAAPLRWSAAIQAHGGTVVMLRNFDPQVALAAIERFQVTHAQFVPTMFVRMLKLDESDRAAHDVSSLRVALHAAAPCPPEVKQKMIDWWGPILVEYYAGTEGNGMTMINSDRWESKPGSVGPALVGTIHICDDDGMTLPNGEVGTVYFERDELPFEYHNDPEKTREAQHPKNPTWTTVGDMGWLDDDDFLFLSDRKSFMIISGGVNIYPAEVEAALTLHDAVDDVAVIGVPDDEMGEQVRAFVKPSPSATTGADLEREIIEYVRGRIAHYKAPKAVEFVDELPRTETGKLVKHELRKRYDQALEAGTAR